MCSQSEDEPHGGFKVPLHNVFEDREKEISRPISLNVIKSLLCNSPLADVCGILIRLDDTNCRTFSTFCFFS